LPTATDSGSLRATSTATLMATLTARLTDLLMERLMRWDSTTPKAIRSVKSMD
jgi:hypothetical protein